MFKHYIMTRFNIGIYDRSDADEWMKDRLELFQCTKLSVLTQECDFEWVIAFDDRTDTGLVEYEIITDPRMVAYYGDIRKFFEWFPAESEWIITSRLDNDDWYKPGAIKAIQRKFCKQEMIIDICYEQLDLKTRNRYTSGRAKPNSPFLSLVERGENPKTCYARPHNKMVQNFPLGMFASKEVLAYMVIHGNNIGNQITGEKI